MQSITLMLAAATAVIVGASSAAGSVGVACGGRVLSRRLALVLAALSMSAGASLAGRAVTRTLGQRLVPPEMFSPIDPAIVLCVVTVILSLAYLVRLPLSTSQTTTGAVIGIGLVRGGLDSAHALTILGCWLLLPLAALVLSRLLHRYLFSPVHRAVNDRPYVGPGLRALVIGCMAYVAFSTGASNAANAAGPLVAARLLSPGPATVFAGIMLAVGALVLGTRLIPAISTDISPLCLIRSALSTVSTATVLLIGSLLGIPSSMVQLTAASVAAARCPGQAPTRSGRHLRRLLCGWVCAVVLAAVLAAVTARQFPCIRSSPGP